MEPERWWQLVAEAVGASGLASIVVAAMTLWGNHKSDPDPNGARKVLMNEVAWLRQQLAIAQAQGFVQPSPGDPDPAAPPPSSV